MEQASILIDQLGGTQATAKLCQIRPPSVSEWRKSGVPSARLLFLRALAASRADVAEALTRAGYDGALCAGKSECESATAGGVA